MRNMKFSCVLLLLCCWILPSQAQHATKAVKGDVINNIVKFDPLQIIHGEFGLHYERRLTDQIGLEVGGGVTFQDYYWHGVRGITGRDFMDPANVEDYQNGVAVRMALRLYPSANFDEAQRLFLGLGVQHKNYSWTSQIEDYREAAGMPLRTGTFEESRNLTDIQILFGQQHFLNSNMMVEYFAGAVLRFQTLEGVNFENWEDKVGITRGYTENVTQPGLILGFRVAYGF